MGLFGLGSELRKRCLCHIGHGNMLTKDHLASCESERHIMDKQDDVVMQLTEVAITAKSRPDIITENDDVQAEIMQIS